MIRNKIAFCIVAVIFIIGSVMALPTTGAAGSVTSGNATIPVTGAVAGDSVTVMYSLTSGSTMWWADNVTASGAGAATVVIWGAPILAGHTYYARACDSTGCGNQISFTTSAITPVPTQRFDSGYNSATTTHWGLFTLPYYIISCYFVNIPTTIFFGFIIGAITWAFFRRTRSVRLISIIYMMLSGMFMYPSTGLMLGIPGEMQALGAVLFALGIAGIFLSFIKK